MPKITRDIASLNRKWFNIFVSVTIFYDSDCNLICYVFILGEIKKLMMMMMMIIIMWLKSR